MSKPSAMTSRKSFGLQPPRSKTTVTRRSPTRGRTSSRTVGSILTRPALASAVTTKSGSPCGVVDPVVGGGGHGRCACGRRGSSGSCACRGRRARAHRRRESPGRCRARRRGGGQRRPNSAARPRAARRVSLRRRVLTSGARSSPSTRPRSRAGCSLRSSGRLMRSSAISSRVTIVVRRP